MPKKPIKVEARKQFEIDYMPLEILLLGLIDGAGETDKHRSKRLKLAHELITGVEMVRVDEPDSRMAKAIFDLMTRDLKNHDNQIAETQGGPAIASVADEKKYANQTLYALATEIFSEPKDKDARDNLYKRAIGTYDQSLVTASPIGYTDAIRSWAWDYDAVSERKLHEDLNEIARILGKHGIAVDLSRAFWKAKLVAEV